MPNLISPNATLANLTDTALKLAAKRGLYNLTRDAIAEAAEVSTGIVSKRFGTMENMRRSLMREAVRRELLPIIAEGLVRGDTAARKAPDALKAKARAAL